MRMGLRLGGPMLRFAGAAVLLLALAAAPARACMSNCKSDFKPVCCNDRMWYNSCYMTCMAPNTTVYAECPAPPLPPPSSPMPSPPPSTPSCDPMNRTYTNLTYTSPYDCHTYTVFDLKAECMPDFSTAKSYCQKYGMELARWDSDHSLEALHRLCADNKYTCWCGGNTPEGFCSMMSQEGHIHFQGCRQNMRFACRSAQPGLCPSPPPPPPSPPPPSMTCDPIVTLVSNVTMYNPKDCRTYVMYDPEAKCMTNWDNAKKMCETNGMELVPHNEECGNGALGEMCAKRRFTCWTGGRDPQSGLCPLMTAEGGIVHQGCNQNVRTVCRSKVSTCMSSPPSPPPPKDCYTECSNKHTWCKSGGSYCDRHGNKYVDYCHAKCKCHEEEEPVPCARSISSPPPSPSPPPPSPLPPSPPPPLSCYDKCRKDAPWCRPELKYCDRHGNMYQDYCHAKCKCHEEEDPLPCAKPPSPPPPSPSPPSPSPPPPVICNPIITSVSNVTMYNPKDCRTYVLYDPEAKCMTNWDTAKRFCETNGMELVPHNEECGNGALKEMCAKRRFTCWTGGRDLQSGLCPLMTAEGGIVNQGCNQIVRTVCRSAATTCMSPPPSPLPPSPPPPKDCYTECSNKHTWCKRGGSYCDRHGNKYVDYCHAKCKCHEEEEPVPCARSISSPPPSPAPPSPPPPSQTCAEKCDQQYPNWNIWVCDKQNKAYRNWCHAACKGCYWYTPCAGDDSQPKGDNVLSMVDGGYEYRMFTVDATQRKTYYGAEQHCLSLGPGWDLVPHEDPKAYDCVKRMCSHNLLTCWLKKAASDGDQCPLIAADGTRLVQGCGQIVRHVCRKKL